MPGNTTTAGDPAAARARAYAQSIVESASRPLLVLDENLDVVSANAAFHDAFGLPPSETDSGNLYRLGDGQWDVPELRRLFDRLVRERIDFYDFETVGVFPGDIGRRTMHLTARPLDPPAAAAHAADDDADVGSNGTGLLLLSVEDVTDRHNADDDLIRSETRYRRLFEAARDGILLLDVATGAITDSNPFMTELLGYAREELLGRELWELGLFADQAASHAAFQQLQDKGYVRYENLPLQDRRGERRDVEFVSNIYGEGNRSVIQCNIRDITERKRIGDALHASLARELHIAETLQYPLTPDLRENAFPGLLLATCYEPALREAEVGGDFYDAFTFRARRAGKRGDGTRVALAVGDVTGKGVLAAALAGRAKDIMRAFLREDHDPGRTLARLNDYLCDAVSRVGYSREASGSGGGEAQATWTPLLLTLSLAVFDPATAVLTICAAGAEPPALLRADGSVEVVEAGGTLLGIEPGAAYGAGRLRLRRGDILLMATDGLTETRLPPAAGHGDKTAAPPPAWPALLGYDGMLAMAAARRPAGADASLPEMSRAILRDARAFGGGSFRDDVCLLLARRR